ESRRLVESRALDAFAVDDSAWPEKYRYRFGWWLDAEPTPRARLEAAYDVLAVASAVPWSATPGTFLDIIGASRAAWRRARGAPAWRRPARSSPPPARCHGPPPGGRPSTSWAHPAPRDAGRALRSRGDPTRSIIVHVART